MQVALCARIEELERELEQRLEYNQNQAAIILAEREWHDSQLSEVLAERDAFQSQNTQLRRELATALERAEDLQGAYDSIKAELYREQERVERADRKCQEWKRERDHALKEMGNEQEAFRRACVRVKSAERRGMEAAFRYSLSHLPPSIFETTVLAAVDFFIDQQEDTPDGE